jgi:hypothetical protein
LAADAEAEAVLEERLTEPADDAEEGTSPEAQLSEPEYGKKESTILCSVCPKISFVVVQLYYKKTIAMVYL